MAREIYSKSFYFRKDTYIHADRYCEFFKTYVESFLHTLENYNVKKYRVSYSIADGNIEHFKYHTLYDNNKKLYMSEIIKVLFEICKGSNFVGKIEIIVEYIISFDEETSL